MEFRTEMAVIVAVAMVVFGGAMYVVMRRQLRPLARMTRRVSELEAWSGQRIRGGDGDPHQIRTLTERFNEFLQKLDDAGGWERTCHGRLRTVLQAAEKEAAHKDFMRVRSMIERKLHDLIVKDGGHWTKSADVIAVAREFFSPSAHSGESFMQSFMRRRHPDRSFEHLHFELNHEDARLDARIDKSDLYELMFNLLHNAGKAADAKVRMTVGERGEMVRIVVENDGKRFPPAVRENLMIRRDSTGDDGEGHGIGLPYVRRIARDRDGDLTLEDSDDLGGARVVLELPLVAGSVGDTSVRGQSGDSAPSTVAP